MLLLVLVFLGFSPFLVGLEATSGEKSNAVSLIFVFDVSSSMKTHGHFNLAKALAFQILEKAQNSEHTIQNYILIPFTNKDKKPITNTANVKLYKEAIQELDTAYSHGPENCLHGIKEGLNLGLPNSFLFVFTNGIHSPDVELVPEILSLLTTTQTRVTFLLTAAHPTHAIFPEYQQIVKASHGQFFSLEQNLYSNEEILEYIYRMFKTRRMDVLAIDSSSKMYPLKRFDLAVDNTMSELIFTQSSKQDIILEIISPSGQIFTNLSFCDSMTFESTTTCTIQNPLLGIWKISIAALSPFSLHVSASSIEKFHFGFEVFSIKPSVITNRILCKPIEGIENVFLIKLQDSSQIKRLKSADIISLDGQLINSFALKRVQVPVAKNIFFGKFSPTSTSFLLQINGVTNIDLKFQRLISPPIKSSLGKYDEELTNCKVQGIYYTPKSILEFKNERSTLDKISELSRLVFLYDITMLELNDNFAKTAASQIAQKLSETDNMIIHKYQLIPFSEDFEWYNGLTTAEVNTYKTAIQSLEHRPTTDHVAKVLFAINESMKIPNPVIVVFTDCHAEKNSASVTQILSSVDKTKTRIIFLLNLDKKKFDLHLAPEYSQIVEESNGEIFTFDPKEEDDIPEVVKFIQQIANANLT